MRRLVSIIIIIPVLTLSSFIHPYLGNYKGFHGSLDLSIDFTPSMFIGIGYEMNGSFGYSTFLGNLAFDIDAGFSKDGKSLYRFEDGKIVKYEFDFGKGWIYSIKVGIGTGDRFVYGIDSGVDISDDGFNLSIFPTVAFRSGDSVSSIFAGVMRGFVPAVGVRFTNEFLDTYLMSVLNESLTLRYVLDSNFVDLMIDYSPITGKLSGNLSIHAFGVKMGGKLEIYERLDYSLFMGAKLDFGKTKPYSWYVENILKEYSSKNYERSFSLAKEGVRLYPTSSKLRRYFSMAQREYLSFEMFSKLRAGQLAEARKIGVELLRKYNRDPLALKRCVNLSEKTILDPRSYADSGLNEEDVKELVDGILHMLEGDLDYAVRLFSKLLLKNKENDLIKVKFAEVLAKQGNWKGAQKLLDGVKDEVLGYHFVEGLISLTKGDKDDSHFIRSLESGDIDHIRDSLYGIVVSDSHDKPRTALEYGDLLRSIGYGDYAFEATYYLGNSALKIGDLRKAVDYLSEAVGYFESMPEADITPEKEKIYIDALVKIIDTYEKLAQKDINYYLSAADYTAKLIKITTDPKERYELVKKRAIYLFKAHDYENALYEFETLVEKDESLRKYYNASLARYEYQKTMRKVVQQSFPVSMLRDDFEKVVKGYEEVLKEDPSILDSSDWIALSYSAAVSGQVEKALTYTERLKRFDKNSSIAMEAFAMLSLGNAEKALELLEKVDPKKLNEFLSALYYKVKGRIHYTMGKYENAVRDLEVFFDKYKGIGMDGEDLIAISDSYMKLGKPEKALEVLSEERLGASPGLYIIRAQALLKVGKYDEAFRTLQDLAESPMMERLPDDLKFLAYRMMGDLSFESANFWKSYDYYQSAISYNQNPDERFLERMKISELIVEKFSGEKLNIEDLEKLSDSKDEYVKILSAVEISEYWMDKGDLERVRNVLNGIDTDKPILEAFLNYEKAKLLLNSGDIYGASVYFKKSWKLTNDKEIFKKALVCAILADNTWNFADSLESFKNDPVLSDIVLYASSILKNDPYEFTSKSGFLQYYILSKLSRSMDEQLERFFELYYENLDIYMKAFVSKVFEDFALKSKSVVLKDNDDPVLSYSRSQILGNLKEISPGFVLKPSQKLEWSFEKKASRYEVYLYRDGEFVKIQSSRKRYVSKKFDEGFNIVIIKAVKKLGNLRFEEKSPPIVMLVAENSPPEFVSASPQNGASAFVKTVLSWSFKDPENEFMSYEVFYGENVKDLRKFDVSYSKFKVRLQPRRYLWFVKAVDEYGNVSFSPMMWLKAERRIRFNVVRKSDIGYGDLVFAFSKDGKLFKISKHSESVTVYDPSMKKVASWGTRAVLKSIHVGKNVVVRSDSSIQAYSMNGKLLWSDSGKITSNVSIDENDRIYYAINGRLVVRSKEGNMMWTFPKEAFLKMDIDNVVTTDRWVVITSKTGGFWVIWIDKDGKNLWTTSVDSNPPERSKLIVLSNETVVVIYRNNVVFLKDGEIINRKATTFKNLYDVVETEGGKVAVLGSEGLIVYNKSGEKLWERNFTAGLRVISGENGEIYVVRGSGKDLEAFDDDGTYLGYLDLPVMISSARMDPFGEIVLHSYNGTIYIVRGASFSSPDFWHQDGGNPGRSYHVVIGR